MTFSETHLENSKKLAGEKSRSIFAGVDVFGRGTFGGGEMSTFKEWFQRSINDKLHPWFYFFMNFVVTQRIPY